MYQRLIKHFKNYLKMKLRTEALLSSYESRNFCHVVNINISGEKLKPKLNYEYLCDPQNFSHIETLICLRKGVGNIRKVVDLYYKAISLPADAPERELLEVELEKEASLVPNEASPHLFEYGEEPRLIEFVNKKPEFNFQPKELHEIGQKLDILRTENLGLLTGSRSYFFRGALADLEQALIRYTVSHLVKEGFTIMSVPDLLSSSIIESCGMSTKGERSQVYRIEGTDDLCLSGTAEMALGGYLRNRQYQFHDLPLKMAAVSRCYRAETSNLREERGIYRVHGFTKCEMFGVTASENGQESQDLYNEIIQIQREMFSNLGIHFQILDMPLHDLGAPAYSKVDFEAWMPGRKAFGEISSASNCTDYQSRRLNISYKNKNGEQKFVHTVNGTACAIPRMLIALCETFQSEDGTITIPPALQPYVSGLEKINQHDHVPCKMTWIKRKTYAGKIL
ncbi:serine--tRNA ligase, mitochondrial [Palaemon carinicauda]|uniref:serine--tRNA ligase, mitochondrial n=1 Tax=Palaemon carinicauda TaxID=392227 RepID=UPI0035B64821